MLTTGRNSTVPAMLVASSLASSRWITAVPTISSPWIAAETKMHGPGRAPWSTRTYRLAGSPGAVLLTGIAIVALAPGSITVPAMVNGRAGSLFRLSVIVPPLSMRPSCARGLKRV